MRAEPPRARQVQARCARAGRGNHEYVLVRVANCVVLSGCAESVNRIPKYPSTPYCNSLDKATRRTGLSKS